MSFAVEVLFAPSTQTYRDDPSTINPLFEIISATEGCVGIYHGSIVEDPNQLLLIVVWETLADHLALMNDAVAYPKLLETFTPVGDFSNGNMFHVCFAPDNKKLATVLNAPYTSYSYVTALKPGKDIAQAEAAFEALTEVTGVEGLHGGIPGKVLERDEHMLLFGWDDPKYHEAGRTLDGPLQLRQQIYELIDQWKGGHVKFDSHKKFEA